MGETRKARPDTRKADKITLFKRELIILGTKVDVVKME